MSVAKMDGLRGTLCGGSDGLVQRVFYLYTVCRVKDTACLKLRHSPWHYTGSVVDAIVLLVRCGHQGKSREE